MKKRPTIFISHSHKDEAYLDELMAHLALLSRKHGFDILSDKNVGAGNSWAFEIESQVEAADLAILLVSADYLASDWLYGNELTPLLERAHKGKIRLIPIIIRPCGWARTPLTYYQVLPRDGKPLSIHSDVEKDQVWAKLYELLEIQLHSIGKEANIESGVESKSIVVGNGAVAASSVRGNIHIHTDGKSQLKESSLDLQFFISHSKEDGDFAENLKGKLKEEGLTGWIDIDVLEAGVDWRVEIDEAILKSQALILILSPNSKISEYVTYEWAFALGSGLRIIPLMLSDTAIHPRLEVFQYMDFTNRRARPWARLFSLLHDIVNITERPNKSN